MKLSSTLRVLALTTFLLSINMMKAQEVTAEQAQEDLRFLQKTIHQDFPFLIKKIDQKTWNASVEEFYSQIPSLQPHEITVGFSRMVSLFKYGHTHMPYATLAKNGVLPINIYHFKDGIYVEGALKEHQKTLGGKLIKIDGVPIHKVLEAIKSVVPVENEQYFKAYGLGYAMIPDVLHAQGVISDSNKEITLTLEKEGSQFDYKLSAIPLTETSNSYNFTIPTDKCISIRPQDKTPLYLKELFDTFIDLNI